MDFTFGIITTGHFDDFIKIIIESIEQNNIPNYEIIIVGNTSIQNTDIITIINFDETIKNGWITKKKNIIADNARYDNIVLLHDYVKLNNDWYNGFLKFGNNYDWCINPIINTNGIRFRDYTLFPYCVDYLNIHFSPVDIDNYFENFCLLPYDFENNIKTNKYMYISGSYYVIKKHIANKFLLDENLCHCQSEDVEYSKRLHNNGIIIKCNKYSSVSFLKYKNSISWEKEIEPEKLQKYIEYCNNYL
jgi:hypothetical protein